MSVEVVNLVAGTAAAEFQECEFNRGVARTLVWSGLRQEQTAAEEGKKASGLPKAYSDEVSSQQRTSRREHHLATQQVGSCSNASAAGVMAENISRFESLLTAEQCRKSSIAPRTDSV